MISLTQRHFEDWTWGEIKEYFDYIQIDNNIEDDEYVYICFQKVSNERGLVAIIDCIYYSPDRKKLRIDFALPEKKAYQYLKLMGYSRKEWEFLPISEHGAGASTLFVKRGEKRDKMGVILP